MPEQANGDGREENGWFGGGFRNVLILLALLYFLSPRQQPAEVPQIGPDGVPIAAASSMIAPAIQPGAIMDLYVFLSEQEMNDFKQLVWFEQGIVLGGENDRYKKINFQATPHMQNNGSLYAYAYLIKSNTGVTPQTLHMEQEHLGVEKRFDLVRYLGKRIAKERKSLLDDDNDGTDNVNDNVNGAIDANVEDEDAKKGQAGGLSSFLRSREIGGHFQPNLTIALVNEFQSYKSPGSVPPHVSPHLDLLEDGRYRPILYHHDFWATYETYVILNETVSDLTLNMELVSMPSWKWQILLQAKQSFEMQANFGADGTDFDEFKYMLMDNDPIVLGITFIVSILHTVFEFLAFKNDIAFWKNAKSMEGLSIKSIFVSLFSQVVIFLYLLDHEETSWMILLSVGVGVVIEFWKITKSMIVTFRWENGLPRLSMKDKDTYKSKTKEIDDKAVTYMSYLLIPLVIGYSIYSLKYDIHKSWYSWALTSLTGAIHMFGFIMMTPQLFINYRLKSVAHMPWKSFMYKAISTFIDDLFAYIIRMPNLQRLSTLKDDVIFVVYLYQRWIYRVDMKRANEYGQVPKGAEEGVEGEGEPKRVEGGSGSESSGDVVGGEGAVTTEKEKED